jgi:hypothetical protein
VSGEDYYLAHRKSLLPVPSHGGTVEKAFWVSVIVRALIPFLRALPSQSKLSPQIPPPDTVISGIRISTS